jgi:hypothetical protein
VEEVPTLSLGTVEGGTLPPTRDWGRAATQLMERVAVLQDGVESPLRANVVFHIPGEVLGASFEGVRTSSYFKSERLLMVQAAVPHELPEQPELVLIDLIKDSLEAAIHWARRRRIADDLPELREIVDKL